MSYCTRSEFFAPRPNEFFQIIAKSSKPFTEEQIIKDVYKKLIEQNPKKDDLVNALYNYEMDLKEFRKEMREKKEQEKAQEQFNKQQLEYFMRNCEPNC
jgi:hypothetical protein